MGEILYRITRVDTDFYQEEAPEAPYDGFVPPILIATGGKRRAKLWPAQYWIRFVRDCEARGASVGLLGDRPEAQAMHYHSAPDKIVERVDEILLERLGAID